MYSSMNVLFDNLFVKKITKMSQIDIISDYSHQNLTEVPQKLLEMSNLQMLYLEGNRIETLPLDFFARLPKLTWLDLRNNKLKDIPTSIAGHKYLENILLSNNMIEYLPNELGLVPKLKVIHVSDNPLVYPKKEIIVKGTQAIISYLREEHKKGIATSDCEQRSEPKSEQLECFSMADGTAKNMHANMSSRFLPRVVKKDKTSTDDIVHKISKELSQDGSKTSLKSFYNRAKHSNIRKFPKNLISLEGTLKDDWMNKLKTLLSEQEMILQQEKNVKALHSWRAEKKAEQVRPVSIDQMPEPPYGTYPECNTILSRADLTNQIDKLLHKRDNNTKAVNIGKLINELAGQLKNFEDAYIETKSPRTQMAEAGEQIHLILDIHKKLLQLQAQNK